MLSHQKKKKAIAKQIVLTTNCRLCKFGESIQLLSQTPLKKSKVLLKLVPCISIKQKAPLLLIGRNLDKVLRGYRPVNGLILPFVPRYTIPSAPNMIRIEEEEQSWLTELNKVGVIISHADLLPFTNSSATRNRDVIHPIYRLGLANASIVE